MRWSDFAVQDLRNYSGLKNSLESIPERINALNFKFTGIKGAQTDKIPVSGGGSHWEDFLLDNIVERERLKYLYKADARMVSIIERGLSVLDDTERLILDRFFIQRKPNHIEKLMRELNLEQARIYKLKDQALRKFTKNMYGIEEY